MGKQLFTLGTVIGFVPDQPDLVYVTDGFFTIVAYIPGQRTAIEVGQTYNVYKQNSTYFLGVPIEGQ